MSRALATANAMIRKRGTPIAHSKRIGPDVTTRNGFAVIIDVVNSAFGSEVQVLDTDEILMVEASVDPQPGATVMYAGKTRVVALKPRPVYDGSVVCFYYVVARQG